MFKDLKRQVRANFDKLAKERQLFYVDIDREEIWDLYLAGFSTEEEKQGHNCNSCKSFLRQYSGVVAIIDNKRVSIWDNIDCPPEFSTSIANIGDYIESLPITNIFRAEHKKCGVDRNTTHATMMGAESDKVVWEHFFFMAPSKHVHKGSKSIDRVRGDYKTDREMYMRAMIDLTVDATDTVLELIAQNSLYKGVEFKAVVEAFNTAQKAHIAIPVEERDNYTWLAPSILPQSVTRFRNSAIGTLVVDLSENLDINIAVEKYEAKVSAGTYKRTTAVATPAMIKAAKLKLEDMGLMDSLYRRHAKVTDIEAENLLFIDKSSELTDEFAEMTKDVESKKFMTKKQLDVVEEITIEKFISDVLPHAKSIEVYLQNNHLNKFVSMTTGENKDAPSLFKWNNIFGWSYTGGITDSIKERVKAAGGQVVGELRCSLSWYNHDDLDIWVTTPSKRKIFYSAKHDPKTGGTLDVDMNAGGGTTRTPVENIIFPHKDKMEDGVYTVRVNQYSRRETSNVGYDVQIEHEGNITDIHYDKSPSNTDIVAKLTYNRQAELKFDKVHDSKLSTKEKWGLKTNSFVKVKQMMLSPNHWNGSPVGNKHFMFMLEDCLNDEEAKPFFNEFLNNTFTENRKTFEVMSNKFKVPASDEQLSGIGFSETLASEVTLRVEGKFKRLLKIKF